MEKEVSNISCRCSEVTLEEFKDCVLNNNLRRLIRSGNPTEEELARAWEKLYEEYAEKSGGTRYGYIFNLSKGVSLQEAKLTAAALFIEHLSQEKALALLQEFGYKGAFSGIVAAIKRDNILLEQKRKELEQLQQGGGSATEEDFTEWEVSIGKFMGYRIDPLVVRLSEFLAMSKRMNVVNPK